MQSEVLASSLAYNGIVSAFTLKLIAIITMVIDHAGLFLMPEEIWPRAIGRLSFPIFAWLIANGAKHTKNINSYMKRLFIFGLVAQVPYSLAGSTVNADFLKLNIMFTLFMGLLAIKIWKGKNGVALKCTTVFLIAVAASILNMEYGATGVLSIFLFYVFFGNVVGTLISQYLLYVIVWPVQIFLIARSIDILIFVQTMALGALLFIFQYNSKPGAKTKYLFYVFYPAHLLVFYLLKVFLD